MLKQVGQAGRQLETDARCDSKLTGLAAGGSDKANLPSATSPLNNGAQPVRKIVDGETRVTGSEPRRPP